MKHSVRKIFISCALTLLLAVLSHQAVSACSTFKLQKGNELIYGHNLNQGDIGVPGMIFINKRGTFKIGRTWSELINKDRSNPSSIHWISRYGSVTVNVFARDFPDGGMNEAGLYIWEMNEDADYPQNDSLPKLDQMNWMQFILDSYSTVDEAIQCASEVAISGWGWHYFVGDASGDCAAIAFIDGNVVVNRGRTMPVPGLFNTPYDRELEILKYYKGFGGLYEPDLNDPEVPRFVKTAVLVRDYNPADDAVEYGLKMLDGLKVYDVPEWSVLFDAGRRDVYFKTRIHPKLKHFSKNDLDFSNNTGVLILNIDIAEDGDVLDRFHPYSNEEMKTFTKSSVVPILPDDFFTSGGLTMEEYLDRFASHSDAATLEENQYFSGIWKTIVENEPDGQEIILNLYTKGDAVLGTIANSQLSEDEYEIEHTQLLDHRLTFTFRTKNKGWEKTLVEAKATIENDTMRIDLFDIEQTFGSFTLIKQDE